LINYGELSGSIPSINLHQLFPKSLFVTKYNGMQWMNGLPEFADLISAGLTLAAKRRAVISDIAGRYSLDRIVEAYSALEAGAPGKVLVLPGAPRHSSGLT
jgi:NADPH2:quinone reductase